jgi:hypothetical protein
MGNVGIVFIRSPTADCGGQSAVGDPPERALAGHCTPLASVSPHVEALVSAGLSVYTPHGAVLAFGLQFERVSELPKTGAALTPGRHEVVIQQAGRRLHAQAVMVSAGARVEVIVP